MKIFKDLFKMSNFDEYMLIRKILGKGKQSIVTLHNNNETYK